MTIIRITKTVKALLQIFEETNDAISIVDFDRLNVLRQDLSSLKISIFSESSLEAIKHTSLPEPEIILVMLFSSKSPDSSAFI